MALTKIPHSLRRASGREASHFPRSDLRFYAHQAAIAITVSGKVSAIQNHHNLEVEILLEFALAEKMPALRNEDALWSIMLEWHSANVPIDLRK